MPTWMFQYCGISTALLGSSTLKMSTFLALVQFGCFSSDGNTFVQPLNPKPEIIIDASDRDQTK